MIVAAMTPIVSNGRLAVWSAGWSSAAGEGALIDRMPSETDTPAPDRHRWLK
jgi:hypothetical protein